ncbi:hypothetical protein RZR97_03155 [Hydrogenimonas thermophila]|uniref:hypothetical protein n=1 Tax=Hydrogenimonas thermophila TaxID=223786 RepID=UPI002936E6B2|nr:hypothetical protein [Hydrogenimonas thermophila]WOE70577.1 hypothetical protein RZR91_03165 [Hydrogenimonas thermophila]WOE73095.1 hypothetical protein RZR97_03155 [Hydrogenimonas thermophila]
MLLKKSDRPAVVLLITLFFIVALGITVTAIMTQSEYFLRKVNATNFYTESNLIFNDLKSILKSESKDINDSLGLYMLTSLPVILNDEKSGIHIEMNCKSGAYGFNPNCLGKNIDSAEFHKCYDIVFALFNSLKIADPEKLISTIADSIDSDELERYIETEIVIEDPWFKQGPIESMDRFKKIVRFYALKSEDYRALNIPWEKYFSFRNKEIDFNYIDPTLATAISPEIDSGSLANLKAKGDIFPVEKFEDAGISGNAKNDLTKAGVKTYVPLLQCSIELTHNDNWSRTEFYYDIEKTSIKYSKTIF